MSGLKTLISGPPKPKIDDAAQKKALADQQAATQRAALDAQEQSADLQKKQAADAALIRARRAGRAGLAFLNSDSSNSTLG